MRTMSLTCKGRSSSRATKNRILAKGRCDSKGGSFRAIRLCCIGLPISVSFDCDPNVVDCVPNDVA